MVQNMRARLQSALMSLPLSITFNVFRARGNRRPSITFKAADGVRGAILFGAGDVVAQRIEQQSDTGSGVDGDRLAKAALIGSVHGGVMYPFVYQFAEALFPGVKVHTVLLKTVVSCGLLTTGGNYFSLFARRLLNPPFLEDEALRARCARCVHSVNAVFYEVVIADLCVWPLYDALCFTVVPPALRPSTTTVVSVCWHTYVSWVAATKCQESTTAMS